MNIRLMRGQVVIREVTPTRALWTPNHVPRDVHTHTGRVLAMGPPARTSGGADVDPGFQVGDLVQFHFSFNEQVATNEWTDGIKALWIPQQDVDGVWDG